MKSQKNLMKDKQKVILVLLLIVILIGSIYYSKYKSEIANTVPDGQASIDQTSTKNISDWKIYRNEEYGFEFKYPTTWKVVSVAGDPNYGKTITVIYPENYSAENINSGGIVVFDTELDMTKPEVQVKGQMTSRVTINNIVWSKNQGVDEKGNRVDAFEYMTGHNGKTYLIDGGASLTDPILSTFKFLK